MNPLAEAHAQLAAAQAAARRLRSEAFVRYTVAICGQRLAPLTLDRYNHLLAFENPLVTGGPVTVQDLAAFVWIMHPAFAQDATAARRASFRATLRSLEPATPRRTALARLWLPALHHRRGLLARLLRAALRRYHANPTAEERFAAELAAAQELVTRALADWPSGDSTGDTPAPYAVQAQILNLLARHLHQPLSELRDLPLVEIAQHLREVLHHLADGKLSLLTRAEAAALGNLLAALNDPQVSGLSPQVSGLSPQVSGLSPQVSGLGPQVSGLSPQDSSP